MTSRLHAVLAVLLLAQLMMMVDCVIDGEDRFTDRLPLFSDIGGQFITNAVSLDIQFSSVQFR